MTVLGSPATPLAISLLGPFSARVNGVPLPRLHSHKEEAILALLILRHGRPVERTWLAGLLWSDTAESQGLATLRRYLAYLRRALGSEVSRLQSPTSSSLMLDLTGATVDLITFDTALARGERQSLEAAVALYRGPLLEGWTEEWVFEERSRREQAYLQALEALATDALERGELTTAEQQLRRVVAVDPLRETAQRALMQTLADGGSYAAAIQSYRELRLLLHRELNAAPDPETEALFQQIRAQAREMAATGRRGDGATGREELSPAFAPSPQARSAGSPRLPVAERSEGSEATRPNLPASLTRFIGREREMSEVKERLRATRLLTFTGVGGCGKTRLALEVTAQVLAGYTHGVWLVELAELTDPALVPQTVAAVLRVREQPGRSIVEVLTGSLRERQALLVLDNCEHLVAACASLADTLLRSCPDLRILATSRQPLGIMGEAVWPVPPLSLPPPGGPPEGEDLTQYESVCLFVDRATQSLPDFRLTPREASAVVQVCRRLDGLPLALELAAARVRALSVEQIAQRLEDRFHLLTGGSRTALPRHQTLRSLIDWSYDLLTEKERVLFQRLSVFGGGWTLAAAEAVCSDDQRPTTNVEKRALLVLRSWSLVRTKSSTC
jgi:predicted ATPase/DNA-binding SARP family transcriptional activator